MDERTVIEIMTNMIYVTLLTSAPMMISGLVVGVAVSIFQTAFSIQEQTLSFVPKIVALSLAGVFFGNWMLRLLVDYSRDVFINFAKWVIK
ncbi:MAG TPA: flagellar biosynthesis protein FliQ [Candidatus Wallbacteria bacterium]|nr:MAG: Flagellar biosynthetic protein FliQ [bacterium ADurb.Bin243]HOD40869.1 flagellar biosynthesis protein FliQ [Candidatus Wallbacteria bacterium]HPG56297.1 flagellar biosynthesis protein FliQ [Candidatus Wallbacteria bacterium]